LPPLSRLNLTEILQLIEQKKYFVLHAPRQTGKTTILLALRAYLNQAGQYRCLYFNVEVGQYAREDVDRAMQAILGELVSQARDFLADPFPQTIWQLVLAEFGPGAAFNQILTRWAGQSSQPLVLLIDEVDSLVGDSLISLLRQLRAGYPKRPALFPQSVLLCGVRDVRDYRIHSARDKAIQEFFREHSEHWLERFEYKEAGPQLLLQAFLQRIVNGGGRVEREYGLGRRRTDLLVIWPWPGGVQKAVIELKILTGSLARTLAEGLPQTWAYADRCGADEAHLVIFDRRPDRVWRQKIFHHTETYQDQPIQVWGV
jgi:hypothetical protein